jgi:hypothetical protein
MASGFRRLVADGARRAMVGGWAKIMLGEKVGINLPLENFV